MAYEHAYQLARDAIIGSAVPASTKDSLIERLGEMRHMLTRAPISSGAARQLEHEARQFDDLVGGQRDAIAVEIAFFRLQRRWQDIADGPDFVHSANFHGIDGVADFARSAPLIFGPWGTTPKGASGKGRDSGDDPPAKETD